MKWLLLMGCVAASAALARAEESFWSQLTPEERTTAGLAQLTNEQRAALDKLAARYLHEGAKPVVEAARVKARAESEAEAKVAVEKEIEKHDRARAGLAEPKVATEAIRSRVRGTFNGWSGRTTFRLENGQTWVQSDTSDSYWVTTRSDPEIEIRPSSFGTWKLFLLSDNRWVRVRRVN